MADFEAQYGKLWEQGREGLDQYLELRKVEPMRRALEDAGHEDLVRRAAPQPGREPRQRSIRSKCATAASRCIPSSTGRTATCTCISRRTGSAYHPLWDKGYVSIGDWHSTKALHEVESAEELRFAGLKRECGIHGLEG